MRTTENNKLIAEFMCLKPKNIFDKFQWSDGINFTTLCDTFEQSQNDIYNYVKYSTSWEWLIPVVEKIEEKYIVDICGKAVSIHENNGEMMVYLCATNYSTKIEAVYTACVEFINWYNKNK